MTHVDLVFLINFLCLIYFADEMKTQVAMPFFAKVTGNTIIIYTRIKMN